MRADLQHKYCWEESLYRVPSNRPKRSKMLVQVCVVLVQVCVVLVQVCVGPKSCFFHDALMFFDDFLTILMTLNDFLMIFDDS